MKSIKEMNFRELVKELLKDAETLRKARDVLAKWAIHIEDARKDVKHYGNFGQSGALVALADALEEGGV